MLYVDYRWDLTPNGIVFDEELNIDRHLHWQEGDLFKIVKMGNTYGLQKVEPIEKFVRGYGNEAV